MNKFAALKLKNTAREVAERFSMEREFNPQRERFSVEQILPLSDDVAAVVFVKNTGKQAVALFYYRQDQGGRWHYFFPSDSHLEGLRNFLDMKIKVKLEDHNFRFNFQEEVVVNE